MIGLFTLLIAPPAFADETLATPVALAELPSELHASMPVRGWGPVGVGIGWPVQVLSLARSEDGGWAAYGAYGPSPHRASLRLVLSPELVGLLPSARGDVFRGAFRFRTTLRFVGPRASASWAHIALVSGLGASLSVAPEARGLTVAPEARGLTVAPEARGLSVAPEARGLAPASLTFEAGLRFDARPGRAGPWWARNQGAHRYPTVLLRADVPPTARPVSSTVTVAVGVTFI